MQPTAFIRADAAPNTIMNGRRPLRRGFWFIDEPSTAGGASEKECSEGADHGDVEGALAHQTSIGTPEGVPLAMAEYEELHNDQFIPYLRREAVESEGMLKFSRTPLGKVWGWLQALYNLDSGKIEPKSLLDITHFSGCFLSCIFCYALSNSSRPPLGNVLAETIITTSICLLSPRHSASVAIGAYSGMSSPTLFPSYPWVVLLAALTSIVWLAAIHLRILVGWGGRLGAICFVPVILAYVIVAASGGAPDPWRNFYDSQEYMGLTWQAGLESGLR